MTPLTFKESKYDQNVRNYQIEEQKNKSNFQPQHLLLIGALIGAVALAVFVAYEVSLFSYEILHRKWNKYELSTFEKTLEKKFSAETLTKLKSLKNVDTICLFRRLSICKEEEQEILNNLDRKFDLTTEQLESILMGAHVRLEDDGEQYHEWVEKIPNGTKNARISSHPSDATQYGIRGPVVKELLFSKVTENGKVYTWFQLENHPVSFGHILRHTLDYFKYKISGRQQGPYGSSEATHHNPIIIGLKKLERKVEDEIHHLAEMI